MQAAGFLAKWRFSWKQQPEMPACNQDRVSQIASVILHGFDHYRSAFRIVTRGARDRFMAGDWQAVQAASVARTRLYSDFAQQTTTRLKREFGADRLEPLQWQAVKAAYAERIEGRADADLAETGYNTIFRKLANRMLLSDDFAFVLAPGAGTAADYTDIVRCFTLETSLEVMIRNILTRYDPGVGFSDLELDVSNVCEALRKSIPLLRRSLPVTVEMLKPLFYRNKGAYLIGRLSVGEHVFPLAIPLQHGSGGGLYVDTLLWNENDLSMIFSFTRSYFMVEIDSPCDMVKFLQEILPNKRRWELFNSIGFYKHGKTEFYRDFLRHLETSDDSFVVAEGIKGMVMTVFALPSYQVVFKVIKDRFSPTKKVTREQVKDAYHLVKTHDRVGRMADTQEFINFVFPRSRFSPELIEELLEVAPSSVTLTEKDVIISHLYTERLMTPLNIYIQKCSEFELRQVVDEYGNAIKQLAAANIFPGDMLLKNFGVTRHGRVVFYDYDEICYLTEVNFREIPEARYPEDELAAEPWYSVAANDVFPEEFPRFLFNSARLRSLFNENHADLFRASYWRGLQENIRRHEVMDVFPYRRRNRFRTGSRQVPDQVPEQVPEQTPGDNRTTR